MIACCYFFGEKNDGLELESREMLGGSRYSVFITHVYIFKGWFRKCLQIESKRMVQVGVVDFLPHIVDT